MTIDMTRALPRIIDADTHVNEPPDLWTTRLPARFRDDAPRVVDGDLGTKWQFPGGKSAMVTPLSNSVGTHPLHWRAFTAKGYEDETFRVGAWDPAARLADMDLEGVDGHVLFPTYVMHGGKTFTKDRDLQIACVQVYNDWLSEFTQHAPDRFIGVAILPMTTIADRIDEVRRVRELPGIKGILMSSWPCGVQDRVAAPDYEADSEFWSVLEDLDLPAVVHLGFGVDADQAAEDSMEAVFKGALLPRMAVEKLAVDLMPLMSQFILGGILERHPRLRLACVEVGGGWVPFFLEQCEDQYNRHRFWTHSNLPHRPSEYWRRQCVTTFQVDRYAVQNRDTVGVGNLLWSSDYPHAGSDWPNSIRTVQTQLADVPDDERALLLGGNTARFFGLDT